MLCTASWAKHHSACAAVHVHVTAPAAATLLPCACLPVSNRLLDGALGRCLPAQMAVCQQAAKKLRSLEASCEGHMSATIRASAAAAIPQQHRALQEAHASLVRHVEEYLGRCEAQGIPTQEKGSLMHWLAGPPGCLPPLPLPGGGNSPGGMGAATGGSSGGAGAQAAGQQAAAVAEAPPADPEEGEIVG